MWETRAPNLCLLQVSVECTNMHGDNLGPHEKDSVTHSWHFTVLETGLIPKLDLNV